MPIDKTFGETDVQTLLTSVKALAPTYAELSNAPAEAGSLVYIDGTGSSAAGLHVYDGSASSWVGPVGSGGGSGATDFEGLDDVSSGTLANRPAAGTSGNWYFTTENGVYYDNGSAWQLVAEHPGNISASELGFDPATQTELDNHAGTAGAHHTKYTDENAQDAVGATVTDGLAYDDANNQTGLNVIDSSSVTLSSGSATIDTGIATSTTATFNVYLGPATNDAQLAADIVADSSTGTYVVEIQETDTSVGNPSCAYDLVRLR